MLAGDKFMLELHLKHLATFYPENDKPIPRSAYNACDTFTEKTKKQKKNTSKLISWSIVNTANVWIFKFCIEREKA